MIGVVEAMKRMLADMLISLPHFEDILNATTVETLGMRYVIDHFVTFS